MSFLEKNIERVLIDEESIAQRVRAMGEQITSDYAGRSPVMICVLTGASIFFADLCKRIDLPVTLDFVSVSSYEGAKSTGSVRFLKDLQTDIFNRDIIIVEDILDTGFTLDYLTRLFTVRHPASIKVACLLNKPGERSFALTPDYLGFTIPDKYVVGYGLDYNGLYRNLPYIGIVCRDEQETF